jgi:aspartyl-tRNA(Asn)/glutamyl-tRNA(Gln) amidotransferase subunit A
MGASELDFISIAEAAQLIRSRKLSPVELTKAKLARIESLDPQLNAFITLTGELALRQARAAESEIAAGRYRGPLHGVPFGLKDLYETAGIRTTGHSKVCADYVPTEDAAVTEKLQQAGGVLLGKLATTEFAHGGPSFTAPWPPARNPWDPERFTGSSSSGSAAAVAAGLVPMGMGSDTGGSVRIPASFCGVVGFKPTFGLVSRHGVIPNSYSFDHCGPLARSVEDCAIVLQAIAGYDARDPGSVAAALPDYRAACGRDLRGLRIGVVRHFWEEDLQSGPETAAAMDAALDVLRGLGAQVQDIRMRPLQDYTDVKVVIAGSEIFSVHQKDLIARPQDFGMHFLAQTLAGCLFGGADYVQAQRQRRVMLAEMQAVYDECDALVTASAGPAPRLATYSILNAWLKPNIHTVFNVTGGPCIAIPNGVTHDGLPLSMQIAARPFRDEVVLRVADAYGRATAWLDRRPRLEPGRRSVPVTQPPDLSGAPVDSAIAGRVAVCAERAGLELGAAQFSLLCEVAPYAFAMAARVDKAHDRAIAPASVFRLEDTDS